MEQQNSTVIISRRRVKKVNKAFYLGSYIGSIVAAPIMLIIIAIMFVGMGVFNYPFKADELLGPLLGGAIGAIIMITAVAIYGIVVSLVLLYKAWEAIRDGKQRTTPGKAVGFLFIPFYNLYWIFQAYAGYAKDYNLYLARYNLDAKRLTEGLFLAGSILAVVSATAGSIVPYIGALSGIGSIVINALIINELCNGINNLSQA